MEADPLVVVAADRFGVGFADGDDVVAAIGLAVGDDVVAAAIVNFGLICNFLLKPSVLAG